MIGALVLSVALIGAPDTLASGHIDPHHLFELINDYRKSQGLKKIKYAVVKQGDADDWAEYLAGEMNLIHKHADFWENLAISREHRDVSGVALTLDEAVLDQWKKSKGHNRTLLEKRIHSGVVSLYPGRCMGQQMVYAVFRGWESKKPPK